jgi:hypothetical protein
MTSDNGEFGRLAFDPVDPCCASFAVEAVPFEDQCERRRSLGE